jgi:hypothetical protein
MAKFCQTYPCEYLSPFPGDYYFFAYLTWTPQLDTLTFFQLHNILNPVITQNMANYTVSPTGAAYATLCLAPTIPEFPSKLAVIIFMVAIIIASITSKTRAFCTNLRKDS